MYQLSLLEYLELLTNASPSDCEELVSFPEILTDDDILDLRENLLIETAKSAFGESSGGRKPKPSAEAWEWIISEEQKLPFSFDNCCIACGADPELMLGWLRYYKRKLCKR